MFGRIVDAVSVAKRVATVARDQEVTFLAASIGYYAFVSVIPTAVLALIVAAAVGGPELTDLVLAASGEFLTGTGRAVLERALSNSDGRGQATLFGLVVLIWGSLKVFRGLDTAFSKVYGVEVDETLVDQLVDSVVVSVSVGLTMLLMFVIGGALAALRLGVVLEAAGVMVLPLVLVVAFLPMYYRFPDVPVSVPEILPGAVFAAVGWTALQALFQLYATTASQNAYGVIGGVLLLITWLYLAGNVVILGAVVNVVLAENDVPGPDTEDDRNRAADDRHFQEPRERADQHMADEEEPGERDREPAGAPDVADLEARVETLRADFENFERDVDERTVDRPRLEAELKQYVRSRLRQGKARGWGPYLVLLYGTVMTLGAFYWLSDWAAVAAMVVVFTSTLGLYVLFVLFGGVIGAVQAAGGLTDRFRR